MAETGRNFSLLNEHGKGEAVPDGSVVRRVLQYGPGKVRGMETAGGGSRRPGGGGVTQFIVSADRRQTCEGFVGVLRVMVSTLVYGLTGC